MYLSVFFAQNYVQVHNDNYAILYSKNLYTTSYFLQYYTYMSIPLFCMFIKIGGCIDMLHLMNTTSFQKNHQNTQLIEWGASSSCINQLHLGQLISWHLINRYCYLPTYLLLVVLTQEKGSHQGYRYVYFAKSTAIIRFDVYCGFQKTGIYTSILCLFTKQVSMWNVYQIVDESIEYHTNTLKGLCT